MSTSSVPILVFLCASAAASSAFAQSAADAGARDASADAKPPSSSDAQPNERCGPGDRVYFDRVAQMYRVCASRGATGSAPRPAPPTPRAGQCQRGEVTYRDASGLYRPCPGTASPRTNTNTTRAPTTNRAPPPPR